MKWHFFHNWGPWKYFYREFDVRWIWQTEWTEAFEEGQERFCTICNKRQKRPW